MPHNYAMNETKNNPNAAQIVNRISRVKSNDPERAGQPASSVVTFGPFSRFALFAVHTRFGAVEWFVTDAEAADPVTKMHAVIAQEPTAIGAVEKVGARYEL